MQVVVGSRKAARRYLVTNICARRAGRSRDTTSTAQIVYR